MRVFRRRSESICEMAGDYVFPKVLDWIPFGDHPLKLERYRED